MFLIEKGLKYARLYFKEVLELEDVYKLRKKYI